VEKLDHPESHAAVLAERSLMRALQGGCQIPVGALASVQNGKLKLQGVVASPDGSRLVRGNVEGTAGQPEELGAELADTLLAEGALEILERVKQV